MDGVTFSCEQPVKKVGSQIGSMRYERVIFARRPLGGSLVILTPFCSTVTGKCGEGYDVSQRRNDGCTESGLSSSHSRSSVVIQLTAKWQFCSTTHVPSLTARSIIFMAMGPCPCPSDSVCSVEP